MAFIIDCPARSTSSEVVESVVEGKLRYDLTTGAAPGGLFEITRGWANASRSKRIPVPPSVATAWRE
jgi:hypothetical protein